MMFQNRNFMSSRTKFVWLHIYRALNMITVRPRHPTPLLIANLRIALIESLTTVDTFHNMIIFSLLFKLVNVIHSFQSPELVQNAIQKTKHNLSSS
jgi:hypothetical protein